MKVRKVLAALVCLTLVTFGFADAVDISLGLSGEGVVKDNTIKAGKPVTVDIYVENDSLFTGFSFGFTVSSPDIKNIAHVADSGNGLNKNGDIKGYNGWQDHSIWNFGGVYTVERDWDGKLPDLIGFGGLSVQQEYKPHPKEKVLSFELIADSPGTIVVDSSYYPPGGRWLFATPVPGASADPTFDGALKITVVK